jgi:hypothetical protein
MRYKNPSKNSNNEKSDNDSSNLSTDVETSDKNPTKKFTLTEIEKLEKQLKLLKEQASKNSEAPQYKKQDKKQDKIQKKFETAAEQSDKRTKKSPVPLMNKETFKKTSKKRIIRPKEESTEWSSSDPEQVNFFITLL